MPRKRVYLDSEERKGQILVTLYATERPITIGQFARHHQLSVSPHLRNLFEELVLEGLLEHYTIELRNGAHGRGYYLSDRALTEMMELHYSGLFDDDDH